MIKCVLKKRTQLKRHLSKRILTQRYIYPLIYPTNEVDTFGQGCIEKLISVLGNTLWYCGLSKNNVAKRYAKSLQKKRHKQRDTEHLCYLYNRLTKDVNYELSRGYVQSLEYMERNGFPIEYTFTCFVGLVGHLIYQWMLMVVLYLDNH